MMSTRKAKVYYRNELAGVLEETDSEYTFQYDKIFLKNNISLSVSLPVQKQPFKSKKLFPFFKGLLPEGWYLNIVSATQHVDSKDFFGILLSTASVDTIGAVTVRKEDKKNNDNNE